MNDHYYTRVPQSESRPVDCEYSYRGISLSFRTDGLPAGIIGRQCCPDTVVKTFIHGTFIGKADFQLGRMHVDIQC